MLTRLRNASTAHHDSVSMPLSNLKRSIAEILKSEGYISDWSEEDGKVGKTLTLELKYGKDRSRAISGIKRVSKPGLRIYSQATEMPKVLGGLGIVIVSTSLGLLTDRQAKSKGVGGELLAYVW